MKFERRWNGELLEDVIVRNFERLINLLELEAPQRAIDLQIEKLQLLIRVRNFYRMLDQDDFNLN